MHGAAVRLMLYIDCQQHGMGGLGSRVSVQHGVATQNVLRNDDPFRIQVGAGIFSLFTLG
jgi:hypothetical protein